MSFSEFAKILQVTKLSDFNICSAKYRNIGFRGEKKAKRINN